MKIEHKFTSALQEAMETFDFPVAYIASADGLCTEIIGDADQLEYPNLPSQFFRDQDAVINLSRYLEENILPRGFTQGSVKSVMGFIGGKDYIFALFKNSELSMKEHYFISKTIYDFIRNRLSSP